MLDTSLTETPSNCFSHPNNEHQQMNILIFYYATLVLLLVLLNNKLHLLLLNFFWHSFLIILHIVQRFVFFKTRNGTRPAQCHQSNTQTTYY